jgi:hypothetical protein
MPGSKEFINQELEFAAKRMLTHITGSEEILQPLYLQPDRALFFAINANIILKVYMEGKTLQQPPPPLPESMPGDLWPGRQPH